VRRWSPLTGDFKSFATVISALLEPVLTGDFKSFATVISTLLEPVLTGDFKSFATVIGALLEPADGRFQELCNGDQCVVGARPDGRFAAQFITYW
jgi:hypothetical protein